PRVVVSYRLRVGVRLWWFVCEGGAGVVLRSFPTRRSSDLPIPCPNRNNGPRGEMPGDPGSIPGNGTTVTTTGPMTFRSPGCTARSEEHTSELQSRENLVCRLLLEKKNKEPTARQEQAHKGE